MDSNSFFQNLFQVNKFVPVVILDDVDKAIPLAHALLAGGIKVMEVTLRTKNALKIIETISHHVPDITVGAGTILSDNDFHLAVGHGAKFIVSPGITNDLLEVYHSYDTPLLPGAITPTEVMQAYAQGFHFLKYFPASASNGYDMLKAFASPFPRVQFCPTGGINLSNAKKFLDLTNVAAVGCSFLVNEELILANALETVTKLALDANAVLAT